MPKTKEELKAEEDALLVKINEEATKAVEKAFEGFKVEYTTIAKEAAKGGYTIKEVDEKLEELGKKINTGLPEEDLAKFNKSITEINESLKEQGRQITKMKPENHTAERKGFGDVLKGLLEEAGYLEEYVIDSSISERKALRIKDHELATNKPAAMTLKAAIDMTTPLTLAPGSDPGTNIGFLTDYSMSNVLINLTKDTHMVNIFPTDPTSKAYIGVLIETTYFDGSAVKLENVASAKSSIKFITKEFKVFTIPTHFKVSLEMLSDVDRLVSKLNRIAPDKILSTLDERILSATGDNDSDIKGLYVAGNFTDFVASDFQDTIPSATVIDLVRKMKLQASLDDQDVNAVLLHPALVDEVEGLKDLDKNFLKARGIVYDDNGNLTRLHGLAAFKNKKNGTNACTVFWNEAAEIGIREDVSFEIGTDADDLTKRMRTIVFWMRAAFGVGKAAGVIYEDDVTGAIAIINKDDA